MGILSAPCFQMLLENENIFDKEESLKIILSDLRYYDYRMGHKQHSRVSISPISSSWNKSGIDSQK